MKMLLVPSRILSRSSFILILTMSHLAASAPVKSRKRSPTESEQGFSASPRILEIQLPLKITSKEDLVAWSKYVMRLVVSKINRTSATSMAEKRGSLLDRDSGSKSKETTKKAPLNEKRPGINYPARRLKEPHRPDDMVVAYPLPIGGMKSVMSKQDSFGLPISNTNGLTDFAQFANLGNPFPQQSEIDFFGNPDLLAQPPASTYLPLPLKTNNINGAYENALDKNTSALQEPVKLQTTKKKSFNLHIKALNNDLEQLPIVVNNGLTGKNVSRESLLTIPFQALITITRQQLPAATTIVKTQPKGRLATRTKNPPDEFPPYFEKNYTLTNEAGQINVVLNNDFAANTSREKVEPNLKEEEERKGEEEEEEEQNARTQKKKKTKNAKTQKSRKRQSSILGDLLRMLGILRKAPKNSTEVNVAPPVFSILKGTNTQKIQVAFEDEPPPNRGRRNETSQAQEELNDDDDDEEEEEEEEEEEGGSIQAIIDLLPLAAPILEELSDPEADVDLAEVLRGAIPLLEGLSDPNEEGGIDIPGVLVPLSQRLSEGPDGQGSDSGAILGPLIQLIAPLIGPLVGPLIGPLSRTSSGPGGKEGLASLITAIAGPLSEPQGPYGQSVLSNLIASITAKLSTELAKSAGDSDVKTLVSSLVQGVLAGTSAGFSGPKGYGPKGYGPKGNRDTYYAPTTYGGYDSYGSYGNYKPAPNPSDMIFASIKEILGAVLKLSATSSSSSAGLSGTSSSSSANLSASSLESSSKQEAEKPVYGAPTNPPYPPSRPSYSPPSTSSPYATFVRRQGRHQKKKS